MEFSGQSKKFLILNLKTLKYCYRQWYFFLPLKRNIFFMKKGIQQQQQHYIEKDDGVYLRAMRQVMILLFMIIVCHTGWFLQLRMLSVYHWTASLRAMKTMNYAKIKLYGTIRLSNPLIHSRTQFASYALYHNQFAHISYRFICTLYE